MAAAAKAAKQDDLVRFERLLERATFEMPTQAGIDVWTEQIRGLEQDLLELAASHMLVPGVLERVERIRRALQLANELLEGWMLEEGRDGNG